MVQAYQDVPLVHHKISANLLNSMLAAIEYSQNHAPILNIPTLLLVALEDHLIDPQGSLDFLASLPANLCRPHLYAGFYHELFNEVDAQQVRTDLHNWLAARHFIA